MTNDTKSGDLTQRLLPSGRSPPVYENRPRRKTLKKVDWKDMPDRFIVSGYPDLALPHNGISTTKYTPLTFIPKNLMEQFSKIANVYFLVIGMLQAIKPISASHGIPVIYAPLTFILVVSAIKDLIEDCKRLKDDRRENFGKTQKLTPSGFQKCHWMDVRVGDIIKVCNNEFIPADMILMGSSEPNGTCFIETKNLDGETNLKPKLVEKKMQTYFDSEQEMLSKSVEINYEKPNPYLYTFRGKIKIASGEEIPLNNNNFLLRACSLKTPYAIGIVTYTGHDTKIMLNSVSARGKSSRLERMMNRQIIYVFIIQNIIVLIVSIYSSVWQSANTEMVNSYLHYAPDSIEHHPFLYFIVKYGNFIVIFTNFVPISLLVTLEMVKFIQAAFIGRDAKMQDDINHIPAVVQCSRLMEELGQVSYIFSDKTGTLTCNIMEFKKLSVLGESFGDAEDYTGPALKTQVTNVNFKDAAFFDSLEDSSHPLHSHSHECLLLLSTCHNIAIDRETGLYSASSPDELALVNMAKLCGYEYIGKTESEDYIVHINGNRKVFKILHLLEFDSDRKRMSVILETEEGKIMLYCKGADSIIIDRMDQDANKELKEISNNVVNYANKGLRTLLIAKKEIDRSYYESWDEKYTEARASIVNREARMSALQEELEVNLHIIGATAIEDKLQDKVGETIKCLKDSGIKVWVLTGDKTETAINIGQSCKLIDKSQKILIVDCETAEELVGRLKEVEEEAKHRLEVEKMTYALVVTGKSLIYSQTGDLSDRLYNIFSKANAVIACRVSPKQKRDIVELVKGKVPQAVTLAIGDGANDVNMITAAHVGIGIKGLEGYQAARASDFAIGEFKVVRRLLLFYGREAYRKNATLVLYNFFKNQLLVLPMFWYGFWNGFSGMFLYEPFIFNFFNLCYTALPIIIYAVNDKEFKGSFLCRNPHYYTVGIKDELFNNKLFWRWFFAGSSQAVVLTLAGFIAMDMSAVDTDGRMLGYYDSGMLVFTSLITCSNLKILLFTNTFSPLVYLIIIGSSAFYIWNYAMVDNYSKSENYHQFGLLFGHWNFWLGSIIAFIATTFINTSTSRYRWCCKLSMDEKANVQLRRQSLKYSTGLKTVDMKKAM